MYLLYALSSPLMFGSRGIDNQKKWNRLKTSLILITYIILVPCLTLSVREQTHTIPYPRYPAPGGQTSGTPSPPRGISKS